MNGITNDILGFKNIRHRLFLLASSETDKNNKIYLYLFHIFESLVSNVQVMIDKMMSHLI